MIKHLIAVTIAAVLFAATAEAQTNETTSLVQVIVTYQDTDPFLPWQTRPAGLRTGYAVMVGKDTFITTESLVRNGKLIELRRPMSGEKIEASVIISDYQVNLALLKAEDGSMQEMVPMEIGQLAADGKAMIMQFNESSRVQKGDARVIDMEMAELPKAPYQSLTFNLLTELSVNGEGAAVVADGKLAGLVMSYDESARIASIVPYPVIEHFVKDARTPPYEGFGSAGFYWTGLIDPAKRAYLKIKDHDMGVLVLACIPGTGAASALQPSDVILEWDGHSVDSLGYYEDADFGRISVSYLIKGRRSPGDSIPVRIVRNGEEIMVSVKLCHREDSDAWIPENVTGAPVSYMAEGGFILMELTGRYLRSFGPEWDKVVDPRLVHMYLAGQNATNEPGRHVVFLSATLPDPINVGYQHMRNAIVTAVNGKPVGNMDDVFRVVQADGGLARLTLLSVEVDIVVDHETIEAAGMRIKSSYRLPTLRHRAGNTDSP